MNLNCALDRPPATHAWVEAELPLVRALAPGALVLKKCVALRGVSRNFPPPSSFEFLYKQRGHYHSMPRKVLSSVSAKVPDFLQLDFPPPTALPQRLLPPMEASR